MMRSLFILLALVSLSLWAQAQLYVGPNIGPLIGRTPDLQLYFYPHNEDWIAASVSIGKSFSGKTLFPRKEAECLNNLRTGGWHVRVGARNDLATQNHGSHLYWEVLGVYTNHSESAVLGTCDSSITNTLINQDIHLISGALRGGYTWNPFARKTIIQRFLIDFGLQLGVPIWSSSPLISDRNHYSGIGTTYFPFRSIAFEPTITLRYRVGTRRYGFKKGQTRTLFK